MNTISKYAEDMQDKSLEQLNIEFTILQDELELWDIHKKEELIHKRNIVKQLIVKRVQAILNRNIL